MIKINHLSVAFGKKEVVKDVSLEIQNGEILGIVGESGSGKSVTALTLMGLVSEEAVLTQGEIYYDDVLLRKAGVPLDKKLYRKYQGNHMSMVFQEPMTSLNPTKKVGPQIQEMLELHRKEMDKQAKKQRVLEVLQNVGLANPEMVYNSYPHELSGGMRQRAMIAMAIILHPGLFVADEPTTALDVTIQNQIIKLLQQINKQEKNAMIFITHDLNLAKRICNRIAVMKDGRLVECARTDKVFENPSEEYTKKLIQAVPSRIKLQIHDLSDRRNILEVRDLNVYYKDKSNSLFRGDKRHLVVKHADFSLREGEILGLVGESGCGKTTLCKAILGLNTQIDGTIRHYSENPQMIFQDPYSSLNPAKTVGWLLEEPLRARYYAMKQPLKPEEIKNQAYEMLHRVGLGEEYYDRHPSELSGGQRQRISIGQALITHPGFVVADEPVSALDVTIQAQVMELMCKLREEMQLSFLFISHDINVVYHMCDRIMVMKQGEILEIGETKEIFAHPQNAYTKMLLE